MTKITLVVITLMLMLSCKPGAKSEQDVRNTPDNSSNVGADEKSNALQLSAQSHQECELKYGRVEEVDEFEYSNGLCIYILKDSEEYPVLLKKQECLDKNFQISSTLSDEVAVCWAKLKVVEEKPNKGVNGECVIEFYQPIDKLRYPFQNEEMSKIYGKCQQLVEELNIENQERTIKTLSTLMNVDSLIGYDNKKVNGECVFEFNEPIDKLRYPFQNEDFSLVQSKCEQLVEMQSIENQERTLKSVTAFVYGEDSAYFGGGIYSSGDGDGDGSETDDSWKKSISATFVRLNATEEEIDRAEIIFEKNTLSADYIHIIWSYDFDLSEINHDHDAISEKLDDCCYAAVPYFTSLREDLDFQLEQFTNKLKQKHGEEFDPKKIQIDARPCVSSDRNLTESEALCGEWVSSRNSGNDLFQER